MQPEHYIASLRGEMVPFYLANAAHWLRERGISATYEYPGFVCVVCSGTHGNANFGIEDGKLIGNYDDGTGIEIEQPFADDSVHLADAIETWCHKENQQQ